MAAKLCSVLKLLLSNLLPEMTCISKLPKDVSEDGKCLELMIRVSALVFIEFWLLKQNYVETLMIFFGCERWRPVCYVPEMHLSGLHACFLATLLLSYTWKDCCM